MAETELNLRLSWNEVVRLLKEGKLLGMKVGRGRGRWRIADPGPKFAQMLKEREEHIVHVPLLTTAEAAEIIGITVGSLQMAVKERRLAPAESVNGKPKMFTVAEVRRYLWKKEKRNRARRKTIRIERVIQWAKILLDEQRKGSSEELVVRDELNTLIQDILQLQEPQRTSSLVDLWNKFETVGYLASLAVESPEKKIIHRG